MVNKLNAENLAFIHDTVIPLSNRAYTIQYFTRFMSEMEQMYRVDYKGKMYYIEELSDLNIFGLEVHNKMLELAWIIMKSDDPDVSGIQSGLPAVKYNYIKLIPRLLGEFAKTDQYPIDDLENLSKAISASVTINSEWMTISEKSYLSSEFKNAIDKSRSSDAKNNLESALKVLN